GHQTKIGYYPISIDFENFNNAYDDQQVKTLRDNIRQRHPDTKIIFSLDRLDYSKGVSNRLEAYEELLKQHPELHGKIIFIINVIPSRETISKYAERKRLIEENISRVNGMFGTIQWMPIIYQYRHLNFHELIACYTA